MSKEKIKNAIGDVSSTAFASIDEMINVSTDTISEAIDERLQKITAKAKQTEQSRSFADMDEEKILMYNDDRRKLSGISSIFLSLFLFIALPTWMIWIPILVVLYGLVNFYIFYVMQAKVDIPDGFIGVVCYFGRPMRENERKAKTGRNWFLNFSNYCPYSISTRDQVTEISAANFTMDYGTVEFKAQVMFKNSDATTIITRTTPASIMKMIDIYSSYILLRIISSLRDSRVKFVGRDDIRNFVEALNGYLKDSYGIECKRATMPVSENSIIDDLEAIRTDLKQVDVLTKEDKKVRLEAAIKTVESDMRSKRKLSRSRAITLKQTEITLNTQIAEQVNKLKQEELIKARKKLEETEAELWRKANSFKAKVEKAKAIKAAFKALKAQFDLRLAALKREIFIKTMPKVIQVFDIDGIGTGIGLNMAHMLFGKTQEKVVEKNKDANHTRVKEKINNNN